MRILMSETKKNPGPTPPRWIAFGPDWPPFWNVSAYFQISRHAGRSMFSPRFSDIVLPHLWHS